MWPQNKYAVYVSHKTSIPDVHEIDFKPGEIIAITEYLFMAQLIAENLCNQYGLKNGFAVCGVQPFMQCGHPYNVKQDQYLPTVITKAFNEYAAEAAERGSANDDE